MAAGTGPQGTRHERADVENDPEFHGAEGHAKHPFKGLREKLKDTKLYDFKVKAVQMKHEVGKFTNIFNPNHRHDEQHEKETDEARTKISEGHRFKSFAPERPGNRIKWYVDGRDYFWAVSVALERAKETIYIADWWLSPELFLRRPPHYYEDWRLDKILQRKAREGVKIYIIVYKEVEQAISCNSAHTKNSLRALVPEGEPGYGNIIVMRHPDHNIFENASDMTFYWAHHEKFIVIDYNLAFIGGLDLCFGRWDTRSHPLADVHPAGVHDEIWPGQDYNNNRIMDFKKVEDWKQNELDKANAGRMPWHDVAMGVIGDCVYDIAEHFVLRWNFCKRDKYKRDNRFPWLEMEGRTGKAEALVGVQRPNYPVGGYVHHPLTPLSAHVHGTQGTVHAQIVRSSSDWSSGILTEHSIQNAYIELISKAKHYVYMENQFFITATGEDQKPVQNLIGKAIVEACVRASKEGRKFRVIGVIPSIPGFAGDLRSEAANGTRAIMDYQYKSICRGENSIMGQIEKQGVDPKEHIFFFNLRSYDRLNVTPALKDQEEKSGVTHGQAQKAQAAEVMGVNRGRGGREHLRDAENRGEVEDSGDRQHQADQKSRFEAARAEAFEGEGDQGKDSLGSTAMLSDSNVTDEPKLGDAQMREAEKGKFVQEELYIHGKVLIVDDDVVLCGSSNINDRSQIGVHDSELSIVMEDRRRVQSVMDGQPAEVGHHATTLRRFLWREHLGLLADQSPDAEGDPNALPPDDCDNDPHEDETYKFVEDPMSDELWKLWTQQATTNTQVFRDLFHADPDDDSKLDFPSPYLQIPFPPTHRSHAVQKADPFVLLLPTLPVKSFEEYDNFMPKEADKKQGHLRDDHGLSDQQVREKLDQIRGHLVWMPLQFLDKVELAKRDMSLNSFTESIYT